MNAVKLAIALAFFGSATPAFAQHRVGADDTPDAIIYVDEVPPAVQSPYPADAYRGSYSDIEVRGSYERVLAVWKDPLTLPHTRMRCVKWAKWPGGKTCIGWAVDERWVYRRLTLAVQWPDPAAAKGAVEQCMKEAAIAAAIAAVLSGGSAALPAFESVMKACLTQKLGGQVNISARTESYWGPWE